MLQHAEQVQRQQDVEAVGQQAVDPEPGRVHRRLGGRVQRHDRSDPRPGHQAEQAQRVGSRVLEGGVVDPAGQRQPQDQRVEHEVRPVRQQPFPARIRGRKRRRRVRQPPQHAHQHQAQHGDADRLVQVDGGPDHRVGQGADGPDQHEVADHEQGDQPVQRHRRARVAFRTCHARSVFPSAASSAWPDGGCPGHRPMQRLGLRFPLTEKLQWPAGWWLRTRSRAGSPDCSRAAGRRSRRGSARRRRRSPAC